MQLTQCLALLVVQQTFCFYFIWNEKNSLILSLFSWLFYIQWVNRTILCQDNISAKRIEVSYTFAVAIAMAVITKYFVIDNTFFLYFFCFTFTPIIYNIVMHVCMRTYCIVTKAFKLKRNQYNLNDKIRQFHWVCYDL